MRDAFNKEEGLALYYKLVLARLAEEKIRQEYFKDEMKTPVHLGIGGEAIPIGVCHSLAPGFQAFGTYRNHSLYLTLTDDTDGFFGELYGKVTGPGKGKAGSMHLTFPAKGLIATSAVVSTTIPVAVGAAFANTYKNTDKMVAVFFGDGAIEEGAFWESLNFACLKKLSILFICEDNSLAIHTSTQERHGYRSIMEAVRGYDCYMEENTGSSIYEVIKSTKKILRQMKESRKPGFLHFNYFRFLEHVGPREDFDAGYRNKPSQDELEKLDPLLLFEKELLSSGCSFEELKAIKEKVQLKIDKSVLAAQKAPFPSAEELYSDVFV